MQLEGPTAAGLMYSDSGSDGPVVVLLHGVLMSGTLWDTVVGGLGDRYRCIVPELPFGAHTTPMPDDADLSLPALATMIRRLPHRIRPAPRHARLQRLGRRGNSSSAPAAPIVSPTWSWSPARPSTTTRPGCPAGCCASTQRCPAAPRPHGPTVAPALDPPSPLDRRHPVQTDPPLSH